MTLRLKDGTETRVTRVDGHGPDKKLCAPNGVLAPPGSQLIVETEHQVTTYEMSPTEAGVCVSTGVFDDRFLDIKAVDR